MRRDEKDGGRTDTYFLVNTHKSWRCHTTTEKICRRWKQQRSKNRARLLILLATSKYIERRTTSAKELKTWKKQRFWAHPTLPICETPREIVNSIVSSKQNIPNRTVNCDVVRNIPMAHYCSLLPTKPILFILITGETRVVFEPDRSKPTPTALVLHYSKER